MKKAVSKRIRITKNGKVIRRQMAVDHFRAKRTGKQTRNKRADRGLDNTKVVKKFATYLA